MFGGTLTEAAIAQNRLDRLVDWVRDLGLQYFEVSDGTIALGRERKLELIRELSSEFTVLSEVGSKGRHGRDHAALRMESEQMLAELPRPALGKVIARGRESWHPRASSAPPGRYVRG